MGAAHPSDSDRELFQARLKEWRAVHALGAAAAPFFLAFLLFGLPWGLGLRSDDFAYVRSILATLERGRVQSYEWLAPFNAVMTSLCVLLWRATGNLQVTAALFMAGSSLLAFSLLFRLVTVRVDPSWAAWLTLAVGLNPVFFNKAADFHGSMSTLALFLLALTFHEARRPGLFLVAAFLAFANRQSSIVLLLLPLSQAVLDLRAGRLAHARLLVRLALFAVAAWGLRLYMNRTFAQDPAEMFSGAAWSSQARGSALALAVGVLSILGFLSLFGGAGRNPFDALRANLRRPVLPICLSAVLVLAACLWPPDLIRTDFPLFGALGWGHINAVLPWLLPAGVWLLDRRLLRPSPYLVLALAYAAVTSLRGIWWDYYFLEIAILCLLVAVGAPEARSPGRFAHAVAAVCVGAGLAYGYLFKVQVDKQVLAAEVFERLERERKVRVDEMSNAPFGYLGWKLFDHFLAEQGRGAGPMLNFQRYVRQDRVSVETQVPWRRSYRHGLPEGSELLAAGHARVGFARVEYRVVDRHGSNSNLSALGPLLPLDPARYHPRPFPLNSREWNDLMGRRERGSGPDRP